VGDAAGALYAMADTQNVNTLGNEIHVAVIPLPRPGPPVISEPRVTQVEPTTAVLRAVVDPKQLDTTYQFQWITEAAFKSDGNSFGAGTASAPVTPADLGSVSREDHVQAAISGLSTRTAYRWRLVAINGQGESSPEGAFETPPP